MESRSVDDVFSQALAVADEHFAQLELEAARSLIFDAFAMLPWELQDDYRDVQDLYREGKLEQANLAWDAWMDKAREMGLI